jgi:hypothetical protein
MHPLSAWSEGDTQEVSPRMNRITERWKRFG